MAKGIANKRAPKACESCRLRKVRCDVTRTGSTCTNCKLDGKICTVPVSKRRHVGDRILGASFVGSDDGLQGPICDAIIDFGDLQQQPPSTKEELTLKPSPTPITEAAFEVLDVNLDDFMMPEDIDLSGQADMGDALPPTNNILPQGFSCYPSPTLTLCGDTSPSLGLPPFIATSTVDLDLDDIAYLQRRGCFTIPHPEARDALLGSYVRWVHPFAPMLDLPAILSAVHGDPASPPVSLLVFQSMMLAASAHCDVDFQIEGHKATRRSLYERCKILHDFGIESDQLAILQSAILMSFWDGDADQVRDGYYWIGVASLHANTLGLPQDAAASPSDRHRQQIMRRTWWTLLTRDRLLAVALRRPIQNRVLRFQVPMLQMEDFHHESLLSATQGYLDNLEGSLVALEAVSSCFMALAQLSDYIDQILTMQYSVQRTPRFQNQCPSIVSIAPKTTGFEWTDTMSCGGELRSWYAYLPEEIQECRQSGPMPMEIGSDMVKVHKALLVAYYSMTLMTLYRPLLSLAASGESESIVRNIAIKTVSQAAQTITVSFCGLYANNLVSCLPDTATAALEPAIVTHLLHSTSEVPKIRDTSFQRFYLCWQILQRLGDAYYLAKTTANMINAAAQKLKSVRSSKTRDLISHAEFLYGVCLSSDESMESPEERCFGFDDRGSHGESVYRRDQRASGRSKSDLRSQMLLLPTAGQFGVVADTSEADLFDQLVCWESGV